MNDKERIKRLEFLIRLLVTYNNLLETGRPTDVICIIINEYCEMHDIPDPFTE